MSATCLAARLRGFDALTPSRTPDETFELLDGWTTLMADAVEGRGGVVTRMEGDGLAAVFGAASPASAVADAALAAVEAAREMVELTAMLGAQHGASAVSAAPARAPGIGIGIGVGVASGDVLVGRAGTSRRTAFVCLGDAPAHALRLERDGAAAGRAVLIDAATGAALSTRVATEPVGTAFAPTARGTPG